MKRVEFVPLVLTDVSDVFTIRIEGEKDTEFRKFFILFKDSADPYLKEDFDRILIAIEKISQSGALESYFRLEGKMNDRVCAIPLLIRPRNYSRHGTLRLYCIRVSNDLLIIGGGGLKRTSAYEEDGYLLKHVELLRDIDTALAGLEEGGIVLKDDLNNIIIEIE